MPLEQHQQKNRAAAAAIMAAISMAHSRNSAGIFTRGENNAGSHDVI